MNLKTNSKIKNIRDLFRGNNNLKKGYQPRTNIVQDGKSDLVTDIILARRKHHFSQLFSVHRVSDFRQTEIHIVESLVPELSTFEVEMAIEKLKRHKSLGIDQIPAELIKTGGRTIHSDILKLINSIWNKEEFPEEWKELIIVPIYRKGDKIDISSYTGISLLPTIYKILSNIQLSRVTPFAQEIIGYHQCGFQRSRATTDHIFYIHQILEKIWEYSEAVHQL